MNQEKSNLVIKVKQMMNETDETLIKYSFQKRFGDKFNVIIDFKESINNSTCRMLSVDIDSTNINDIGYVYKELYGISDNIDNIVLIPAEKERGIIAVDFDNYSITNILKNFLSSITDSIVKSMKMTSFACPEQYDCFDEYGNQVAYLRLRHGVFTVYCPNYNIFDSNLVYETDNLEGDGEFYNDNERIRQFENAIACIDSYYENVVKTIYKNIVDGGCSYYQPIDPDCRNRQILEKLYLYEQSNFTPSEVMVIRKKGPVIGYEESILKLIKSHRLARNSYFPESHGARGLSDEHIEQELEFFKSVVHQLVDKLNTINWLFDKTFEDFEKLFRKYSKKGWNSL